MATTDWEEESEKLKQTVIRIDELIEKKEDFRDMAIRTALEEGSSPWTYRGYTGIDENAYLRNARRSPYFGRTDVVNSNNPEQTQSYYIGRYHIPLDYVYSLGSPVAHLFYDPFNTAGRVLPSYLAGCTVTLKRILSVQEAKLVQVQDALKIKPGGKPTLTTEDRQYLTGVLSDAKGQKLKNIIVTIQPEQYQVIASANLEVVVVDGVAGSGKTEVGLHRIIYLLSPVNEMKRRINPEKVAFVGPSMAFLAYVANLLPGEGIEKVTYSTFKDWLRRSLPAGLRLQKRDVLLDKMLCNAGKSLEAYISVAKFKTSIKMKRIIENYVGGLHEQVRRNAMDILWQGNRVASTSDISHLLKSVPERPLNALRRTFISRLAVNIRSQYPSYNTSSIREYLERQFGKFWPQYEPAVVYQDLLTYLVMSNMGKSTGLSDEEIKLLLHPVKGTTGTVSHDNTPAICYINVLLNGATVKGRKNKFALFDHIVIDECQDLSPIEFAVFSRYSNNGSFTILMDTNQTLLLHKSVLSWREIKNFIGSHSTIRFNIRASYRPTYELARFANRILGFSGAPSAKAIPYGERHGQKPRGFRSKSYTSMVTAISKDIEELQRDGYHSICVLCKTDKEARLLMNGMIKQGAIDVGLLEKRITDTGAFISPIYNAKGMEFDAVILANARRTIYPNTPFHNKLLYLGVTRAAHVLHVHWYGTVAEVLDKAKIAESLSKRRKP